MMDLYIGVDVGTSSARAVAFDAEGRSHAVARRPYHLRHPGPGRAELDVEEVWNATAASLRDTALSVRAAGHEVRAVSLSTFMHSLLALDGAGDPLTGLITWADARAAEQARALRQSPAAEAIYRRTGVPLHAMSPVAKLLWFRAEEPRICSRAARWASVKDLLLLRLTGRWVVDVSVASSSGLLELRTGAWDRELLEMTEVQEAALPSVVSATEIVAELGASAAASLELPPGTPVVAGAADGVLANLGVGALDPRITVCSVGTSGAVRRTVPDVVVDDDGRTFCYALDPEHWVVGGSINNGGVVLDWLLEKVFPDLAEEAERSGKDAHELLDRTAARSEPGAGGLVFLPYLLGERAPQWNPSARGVIFGLRISHGREDIVRAAIEGVVLQLRSVDRILDGSCEAASEMRATGGFGVSKLWCQTMADAFGKPLTVAADVEATAWGAAMVALKATGGIDSFAEAPVAHGNRITYQPRGDKAELYERLSVLFERLYSHTIEDLDLLLPGRD
jgi:gluconokinase